MFLRIATLLVLAAIVPEAQDVGGDVKQDVHRVIDAWSVRDDRSENELARELTALGSEATPYLCDLLDIDYAGAPAESLAEAVGVLGHRRAPETLARLLSSEEEPVRRAAVEALGALGVREACPPLFRAMEDRSRSIGRLAEKVLLDDRQLEDWVAQAARARMAEAERRARIGKLLGEKGGAETHKLLLELADDWREEFQVTGLQGLYVDARPEDGQVVTELLETEMSRAVRMQAALVLGKLGHWGGVRGLIDALYEDDQGLVKNAHWALGRITGLRLKPDPELWEQWWERKGKHGRPRSRFKRLLFPPSD